MRNAVIIELCETGFVIWSVCARSFCARSIGIFYKQREYAHLRIPFQPPSRRGPFITNVAGGRFVMIERRAVEWKPTVSPICESAHSGSQADSPIPDIVEQSFVSPILEKDVINDVNLDDSPRFSTATERSNADHSRCSARRQSCTGLCGTG